MKKRINITLLLLPLIFHYFSNEIKAQDIGIRIQWDTLTLLPPAADKTIQPGVAGAFAGMHNGVMIVAGGANFPDEMPWKGGEKIYWDDIFVYDIVKNKWKNESSKLPFPIAYGGSLNTPKGILCIGGRNKDSISSESFFICYNKEKKIQIIPFVSLPEPLFNISVAWLNGKVYVAGGEDDTSTKQIFLSIDLTSTQPKWKRLPLWNGPSISLSVLVPLIEQGMEYLYLVGGKHIVSADSSFFISSLFKFDVMNNKWYSKSDVKINVDAAIKISGGTAFAISDSSFLLAGGNTADLYDTIIRQNYDVIHAGDGDDRQIKKRKLDSTFQSHPGFSRNMYLYNSTTDSWRRVKDLPFPLPVTLNAFKYVNQIYLPSGEIKPGIRSPLIIRGTIIKKGK